jgi:hypothetical protein
METLAPARPSAARVAALALAAAAFLALAPALHAQAPPGYDPNDSPRARIPHALRPPDAMHNGPRTEPPASTLPPTPPTSAPAPQTVPDANTLPGPMAATPLNAAGTTSNRPHRAQVTYANGQLNVRANDSSLNQILRAISAATGLTITGGVTDQRVFGNYGPASTAAILATLLDGTGTNMLLTEGDATTPPTLILTPRGGAASPPSPSAVPDDSIADTPPPPPPQPAPAQPVNAANPAVPIHTGNPIPPNNVLGSQYNSTPTASQIPTTNSVGIDTLSAPSTTPAVSGIVDSPNPPTGATPAPDATPASPGTLTPEAVYQQLLKMQQKQAAPPATQTPATPPQ